MEQTRTGDNVHHISMILRWRDFRGFLARQRLEHTDRRAVYIPGNERNAYTSMGGECLQLLNEPVSLGLSFDATVSMECKGQFEV